MSSTAARRLLYVLYVLSGTLVIAKAQAPVQGYLFLLYILGILPLAFYLLPRADENDEAN